jgi:TolA-binding protein
MLKKIVVSSIFVLTFSFGICFASNVKLLESRLKACPADLFNITEELKDAYFREGDFTDFLNILKENRSCVKPAQYDYYNALAKYSELKKLEAEQNWQTYFEIKDSYEAEINKSLKDSLDYYAKNNVDQFCLGSRYLSWFIEKENSGSGEGKLLDDLMQDIKNYNGTDIKVIKNIADRFNKEGLKSQAENLYALYAKKLLATEKDPEILKTEADSAFNSLNINLATALYDARLELLSNGPASKEYCQELVGLIKKFADNGFTVAKDAFYAEKLFKKLEQKCLELFDADLTYLRAYNLERLKEYKDAAVVYQKFISNYPLDRRAGEARFHTGIISLYVLKEIDTAFEHLNVLSRGDDVYAPSANYYAGLYYQWNKNIELAKSYYEKAKNLLETENLPKNDLLLRLVGERLSEISDESPMEENLKSFLDATFSPEQVPNNVEIVPATAKNYVGQTVKISVNYFSSSIGCFQPEVKFFWSQETGNSTINNDTTSFDSSFAFAGSKVLFLTYSSAGSLSGKQIEIIDIYNKE